jgi:hypothetical protein
MVMRKLTMFFVLLTPVLLMNGCSSGGSDSPTDSNAHPQNWFSTHVEEALASPGYDECKACHGADLGGGGDVVGCYSCHAFNTEPPFSVHPPDWTDTYSDHRADAAANGFASCAGCHGQDLRGRPPVPSCYSANFDGSSCHASGPGSVPHPLDGSYLEGEGEFGHGQDAKADLTACQACHGELGGPGSNPRFNIGFGDDACEDCHGTNYAHPSDWAGPNNTFHYTADNIDSACTLCHGVDLDGVGATNGGGADLSCQGCHDSVVDFALNCSFCHGYPPDGSPDLDVPIGVIHGVVADVDLHVECLLCHGMIQSDAGGSFDPASNYSLFDYATETNGDHWDGNIQMSLDFQYNEVNFGCDAANCHGVIPNTPPYQMSDSGLPVLLKNFFGGN